MKKFSYVEIALGASLIFMLLGIIYSWSQSSKLEESRKEFQNVESEIIQTVNYKKSWEIKGIDKKIKRLKNMLPSHVTNEYKINRKKAYIKLSQVDVKAINKFLVKLSSMPVQFITLEVDEVGDKYNMECRCKW